MAAVISHRKFVCADATSNHNKFWECLKNDDGTVVVKFGRVGSTCNVEPAKALSDSKLEALIKSKVKKGYREIAVLAEALPTGPSGPVADKKLIREAATKQLLTTADRALVKLVERLVDANRHELNARSGGTMTVDLKTGIISTPVGVVTKDNVKSAREILDKLSPFVSKHDYDAPAFISQLNDYLMLVPQKVGHSRGWHRNFLPDLRSLQNQSTFLDQLETSADIAEARRQAAVASPSTDAADALPSIFNAKLETLSDSKVISKIEKIFREGVNGRHESARLKPKAFYEVELASVRKAWDTDGSKLSNQMLLWHGTRTWNLLSILKSGLIIPRSGGSINITGRMFGDGLYFSDQSTKSLNYAYGFWDGGARDKNCFMFLADVGMGNYYVPDRPVRSLPRGYDSIYAQAHKSGVINNEMIVMRTSQANLRYLVEFE